MRQNSTKLMKKHIRKEFKEPEPKTRPFGSSIGAQFRKEHSC